MKNNRLRGGYSILEFVVVIIIISVLTAIALPYYQNAAQSTRNVEAVIWWGRLRNTLSEKSFTQAQADRMSTNMNEKNGLKYFTFHMVCRPNADQKPCWEAEFRLKTPGQSVQYYLTTRQNFKQLVCVPQNDAGDSFCQSQSGQDDGPDTQIDEQPAYIVRH